MALRHAGGRVSGIRRGLVTLAAAAAIVVPGALVCAPAASAASPAAASNPLGPTVTQLETVLAVALANVLGVANPCTVQVQIYDIERDLEGPVAGPPPLCES